MSAGNRSFKIILSCSIQKLLSLIITDYMGLRKKKFNMNKTGFDTPAEVKKKKIFK